MAALEHGISKPLGPAGAGQVRPSPSMVLRGFQYVETVKRVFLWSCGASQAKTEPRTDTHSHGEALF